MPDDSKSEGPYIHEHEHSCEYECLACAYAAGRNAERKRCARIAKLNCTVEEIVDMIMGGQDGE